MRRMHAPLAAIVAAIVAIGLAACGDDDDNGAEDGATGQNSDLTFSVITHGEGDTFWAVAKAGAEQAGEDLGVTVNYQESQNDPQRQAQLVESAITEEVDGIATSVPDPDALSGAIKSATDADIPVVTLNSGSDVFEKLGAITHVGQDETIAGEAAGERLSNEGATKAICIIHEQANIGLDQRCEGTADGFGGEIENLQVTGVADLATTQTEISSALQADSSIDGVLALNPDVAVAARDAVTESGSEATVATFDLSPDVITAIGDGEIAFAIDQQQYLQGYLPVEFLYLFHTNQNTVGGGFPVLTGPGFVDETNAETVADLAEAGTR
ncbi:MAG TPA: sugar ABC transporter substrate-binding protein [Solirubrobacterales bacterium]|nr:sugar ABC transporter substrate-binding protein [Solirubrobacterales bacterium]